MATVVEAEASRGTAKGREAARPFVARDVSWQTFEAMDRDPGFCRVRITYDRGVLVLMSPSPLHDRYKKLFGRLIEDVLVGLRMPFEAAGESRWKKEAERRGLEADESYFLGPEKLAIVAGRAADRPGDPFPDLAVEIDLSDPAVDRMDIYAALGVPEVWRFDGEAVQFLGLRAEGTYEPRREPVPPGPTRGSRRMDRPGGWPGPPLLDRPRAAMGPG